jgi:hypothetical protein
MRIFIRLKIAEQLLVNKIMGIVFTILLFLSLIGQLFLIKNNYLRLFEFWPLLILDIVLVLAILFYLLQTLKWKNIKSSLNST